MPKGKKYGGRTKGTPNKNSLKVEEILAKHNFNVIEEMILLYQKTESEENPGYSSVAGKMLSELASYIYPKRKAIEHSGPDGGAIEFERRLKDLPDGELLKLLPEAITVLKK